MNNELIKVAASNPAYAGNSDTARLSRRLWVMGAEDGLAHVEPKEVDMLNIEYREGYAWGKLRRANKSTEMGEEK